MRNRAARSLLSVRRTVSRPFRPGFTIGIGIAFAVAGARALFSAPALAETFPDRAITIIVPSTANGPSDQLARLLAQTMSRKLRQEVRIENIAGEGGAAGAAQAAKSAPDGYIVLLHNLGLAVAPAFHPDRFDPVRDFAAVGLISEGPYVLSAREGLRIRTANDAIEYIRNSKGKATLGHAGIGSDTHVCNLMFKAAFKLAFTEKAYRGTGPAIDDLAVGQIDFLFAPSSSALKYAGQGSIAPLAVTGPSRLEAEPSLPTLQEAGAPGFDVTGWYGLFVPRATPRQVVDVLSGALRDALADEILPGKLEEIGIAVLPPAHRGAGQADARLRREAARWNEIVAGLKPAPAPRTKADRKGR